MLENKELGLKIAENPRERVIEETIENTEKSIINLELQLEMNKNTVEFLKSLKTFKQK